VYDRNDCILNYCNTTNTTIKHSNYSLICFVYVDY
jgi:hypothetical protein